MTLMDLSVRRREAGQAFPIYITVVAGLLFLALAYFAVGQAAVARDGAQSAADSAALAAAIDAREQLSDTLLANPLSPEAWTNLLGGGGIGTPRACADAQRLAGQNGADVRGCHLTTWPGIGFAVEVRTRGTVGDSIVPGTEHKHAKAGATAVLEPRCKLKPPGSGDEPEDVLDLSCDFGDLLIDPSSGDFSLDPADLFTVRLKD